MKWILLAAGVACWSFAAKVLTPLLMQIQVEMSLAFLGALAAWLLAIGAGGACAWFGVGEVLKEEVEKAKD